MKYLIILYLFFSFIYPALIQPEPFSQLNTTHVLFEWDQVPNAIDYNLQVSSTPDFNNILVDIFESSTLYIEKSEIGWENNYFWRVRPKNINGSLDDWISTSSFSTRQPKFEVDMQIFNSESIQSEYILFSQWDEYKTAIFDINGNEIWNDGESNTMITNVNKFGQLFGSYHNNSQRLIVHGTEINSKGEKLWLTDGSHIYNKHEFIQLPNGNYLGMENIQEYGPIPIGEWSSIFQSIGYVADGITLEFPWLSQKIIEYDAETKDEVWSWNPFNYFTMNDYDEYGNSWTQAINNGFYDWTHTNGYFFDELENVLYISFRNISRIAKISYPSGDLVWMIGLPTEYISSGNQHICTELLFSYQHHIQLLDNGNLLFFDNGNLSEILLGDNERTSRIREIKVIDNSYCETVFEYDLPNGSDSNSLNLMSPGMGSVQLLDNGNYLINSIGNGGSIFEVSSDNQEIVWLANLNLNFPNANNYRSYNVKSIYPNVFSVVFPHLNDENTVISNSFDIEIFNKSDYSQLFSYSLSDSLNCFVATEDTIHVFANESIYLSFDYFCDLEIIDEIEFNVKPIHHQYNEKNYSMSYIYQDYHLYDINNDSLINIIDIIDLVNCILYQNCYENYDVTYDGIIDVIDIINIVNFILGD